MINQNDKKNIKWNAIGVTLLSISSLIFLIIVTRINGINDAGIFTYSFASACLFYIIAMYSNRAFQVTDNDKNHFDIDYIYNRLFTLLIMLIVVILFSIIANFTLYKAMMLILLSVFKGLEAISETLYAIIQKDNKLNVVGKSMTIKSISNYIVFFIVDILTKNIILSLATIIFLNLLIMYFYDFKEVNKIGIKYNRFNFKKNNELLKNSFGIFIYSFLSLYIINSSRYAIDNHLETNMQTIFGILIMPTTVMSLLSQFIIQPFLVRLKDALQFLEYKRFMRLAYKIIFVTILISSIIIIASFALGIPGLELIYGVPLESYSKVFMAVMIGSLFFGLSTTISFLLLALRKTFSQVVILFIVTIITFFLSNYLVIEYEILGAGMNYLISMLIEFVLYLSILVYCFINLKKYLKNRKDEVKR